jgi:DNA mismatch endonuclease (patch repair protein)
MADVFSKTKRSEVMSLIRGRGNKETELALAKLLRHNGIKGWKRHLQISIVDLATETQRHGDTKSKVQSLKSKVRNVEGFQVGRFKFQGKTAREYALPTRCGKRKFKVRPDFVFRKERLAVFVDGCFWHGCPRHATWPRNNRAFWKRKLSGNKKRDLLVNRTLRRAGWRVARIWECALQKKPERIIRQLRELTRMATK